MEDSFWYLHLDRSVGPAACLEGVVWIFPVRMYKMQMASLRRRERALGLAALPQMNSVEKEDWLCAYW